MKSSAAPLSFLGLTLVSQIAAVAVTVLAWSLTANLTVSLVSGSLAALCMAIFFELSPPWQLLNFVCLPAAAFALVAEMPSWAFAVMGLLLLVIYAPAFWTRVPYYPTSRATYAVLLPELPVDRPFTFVDLGCGFGDLLLFLSEHRPNGKYVGVELGLLPFLGAWVHALFFGRGRVSIRLKSIWAEDLGRFDVVYAFLSPAPMDRLWEKVKREMRTGALFVTNTFNVPEDAARQVDAKDERSSVLYFHDI